MTPGKSRKADEKIIHIHTYTGRFLARAQCLEVDVASQARSPEEALANLREAIELHFEPPSATIAPNIGRIEVEIDAA